MNYDASTSLPKRVSNMYISEQLRDESLSRKLNAIMGRPEGLRLYLKGDELLTRKEQAAHARVARIRAANAAVYGG